MLVIYDALNKGEYPYIHGTFTFGEYGTSLVPVRGFLLKGKNFDVYTGKKSDLRESILSRVHKNDEEPAPLVVTTEVGINNDYADRGLLVLFTTDGAMMVTPTEKGYKLFLKFGDDVFIVDKEGFRPAQDEEKANVHWFTVNQLKQGINADDKLDSISRNDGWEEYFTYRLHITDEGDVRVCSAHNFMGGILVNEFGSPLNENLWDWYVLTEDARRRKLNTQPGQYHPNEEQADVLVKESDYSVVKSALKDYEREYKARVQAMNEADKAKEEGAKTAKRAKTTKVKKAKASGGQSKASKASAAAFLAAVAAVSPSQKD